MIVVAIPLGLFTLLALGLLYTVGYVAGAHAIGRLLVKPPTSRFLAFLAGWGILRVLGLIPAWRSRVAPGVDLGLGALWVASRRTTDQPPPHRRSHPPPRWPGIRRWLRGPNKS